MTERHFSRSVVRNGLVTLGIVCTPRQLDHLWDRLALYNATQLSDVLIALANGTRVSAPRPETATSDISDSVSPLVRETTPLAHIVADPSSVAADNSVLQDTVAWSDALTTNGVRSGIEGSNASPVNGHHSPIESEVVQRHASGAVDVFSETRRDPNTAPARLAEALIRRRGEAESALERADCEGTISRLAFRNVCHRIAWKLSDAEFAVVAKTWGLPFEFDHRVYLDK